MLLRRLRLRYAGVASRFAEGSRRSELMTTQHARRWAVAAALFGLVAVTGVVPAGADVQDVKQFTIDVDGTVAAFSGDPDVAVYGRR